MGGRQKKGVPHRSNSGSLKLPNKKEASRPVEQQNHVRKKRGGKHFTWEDRVRLEAFAREYYPKRVPNFSALGRLLGRNRTTIGREYRRGETVNRDSNLKEFPVYSAQKGQDAANRAALNKGPRGKLTNRVGEAIRELIIEEKLSPYAAVIKLKKQGHLPWVPCARTVYYAIDAGMIGVSRQDLPYKPNGQRRKKVGRRMAYTNVRGRPISERPAGAEDRKEYGHWEMDTVVGGTGTSPACLLVMTERMSRRQIICKIPARTQQATSRALDRIERSQDNVFKEMKSLTCDNGCEFLDFGALEKSALRGGKRCEVFYAHPFCSCERGSNENANRVIRRFIPKGADISKYTNARIKEIEQWMNNLPRKILDGMTAAERVETYFKENAA